MTIGVLCRTNSKNEIKWVQALEKCGIEYVFLFQASPQFTARDKNCGCLLQPKNT